MQARSQKFCNEGGTTGLWGLSPSRLKQLGPGTKPLVLKNFVFFYKNKLILGAYFGRN